VVVLLALAACGGDDAAVPEPRTELTISVWAEGRGAGEARTWTLSCGPPAGSHPNPEEACRRLATLDDAFAPVPSDMVCTAIYGGPAVAVVSGDHAGERVDASFDRINGCEIDRWDRHAFLFPVGPGSA
jgi:Subtilisin inhibitor-like